MNVKEDEPIPIPTVDMENKQAIKGVEEHYVNEDNTLEEIIEIEGTAIQDLNQAITQTMIIYNEKSQEWQRKNTEAWCPYQKKKKIQMNIEDINITSEINTSSRLTTETENGEISEVSERTNK